MQARRLRLCSQETRCTAGVEDDVCETVLPTFVGPVTEACKLATALDRNDATSVSVTVGDALHGVRTIETETTVGAAAAWSWAKSLAAIGKDKNKEKANAAPASADAAGGGGAKGSLQQVAAAAAELLLPPVHSPTLRARREGGIL